MAQYQKTGQILLENEVIKVFVAKEIATGDIVVIKQYKEYCDQNGVSAEILKEMASLKGLKHKNIIKLRDSYLIESGFYLVFEYYSKTFWEIKFEDNVMLVRTMKKLLNVVNYLHCEKFIHCNINPGTILYKNKTPLLTGFNYAVCAIKGFKKDSDMFWYEAPETLLKQYHDNKIDIWSLGCLFYYMITGEHLFPGDGSVDMIFRIFHLVGQPVNYLKEIKYDHLKLPGIKMTIEEREDRIFKKLENCSYNERLKESFVILLARMLDPDPRNRATSGELLKHELFGLLG